MLINNVKRMRRGDQWWPVLRGIGSKLDSPKNYVQNQSQKTRLHFLKTHIISFEEVGKKRKPIFPLYACNMFDMRSEKANEKTPSPTARPKAPSDS